MLRSIQSLLDYGKIDGRAYVLLDLHYNTSYCVTAQVQYLSLCAYASGSYSLFVMEVEERQRDMPE